MTAKKQKIISFVMSGGVGSRLWPLSREDFPKQFHNLSGQGSMLLRTVKRMGARNEDGPFRSICWLPNAIQTASTRILPASTLPAAGRFLSRWAAIPRLPLCWQRK